MVGKESMKESKYKAGGGGKVGGKRSSEGETPL